MNKLIEKFNLPSYIKGKSFAEASKLIENKFKDRVDRVSMETKNELLERLADAQEELKQLNNSNTFAYGGNIDPTKKPKHKDSELISLPDDNNEKIAYANRKKLSVEQLGGFEDQKQSDINWRNKRDQYFSDEFSKWRSGKTGATPHEKYSQSHPEYQAAWKRIKDDFYKNNPREINTIVDNYRLKGPDGNGRGQTFGIPNYFPKKEMLASNDFMEGGNMTQGLPGVGDYLGAATTALDFGMQAFSDPNMDVTGNVRQESPNVALGAASNTIKGIQAGSSIGGPIGGAIGGGLGLISGIIGGKKAKKAADEANHNNTLKQAMDFRGSDFMEGGYLNNNYMTGGPIDTVNSLKLKPIKFNSELPSAELPTNFLKTTSNPNINFDINPGPSSRVEQSGIGKLGEKAGNFLKNNYGSILRYAPLVGNLTEKLDRPNTPRGSRVSTTYSPQLFDEDRLLNSVNQNNINKGLQESSGGDLGALRSNIIGGNLAKLKSLSDGYFRGNEQNRSENRFKFQNDFQKDQINTNLDLDYLNRKAADEGAYNTAKSSKRAALFEDVGKIGKEEVYKKLVKETFGYTWDGRYWKDKSGKRIEDSVVRKKLDDKKSN